MGAQGSTTVNFGAFPGGSDASTSVASVGVLTTSLVEAWIMPVATADHSIDEHWVEPVKAVGWCEVNGTIQIRALNTNQINEPSPDNMPPRFQQRHTSSTAVAWAGMPLNGSEGRKMDRSSVGTRLYGQFTVAWVWN